jgi:carbonic anhydrase
MNQPRIASLRLSLATGAVAVFIALSFSLAAPPRAAGADPAAPASHAVSAVTPDQALSQLMAGNARFVAHTPKHPNQGQARVHELASGQHPVAVVLSCSDSRVPPELVFDQGLGDLFVVRVAGNVADDAAIGSIEYAVEHLGAPLIIVMGHQKCGAVTAAMNGGETGNHIHAVVDPIMPVVSQAKQSPGDPVDNAIRLNVNKVVGELERAEPILSAKAKDKSLKIVGAYYSLDNGAVTLLGAAPVAPAAHATATAH